MAHASGCKIQSSVLASQKKDLATCRPSFFILSHHLVRNLSARLAQEPRSDRKIEEIEMGNRGFLWTFPVAEIGGSGSSSEIHRKHREETRTVSARPQCDLLKEVETEGGRGGGRQAFTSMARQRDISAVF